MTSDKKQLSELRDRIDAIDAAIHDLIMERTEVVEGVRKVKDSMGSKVMIRPSREAEVLYRLMERHKGPFPKPELARIWRELIVATLSFEGPFSVAVYTPEDEPGYWDLARDQYGTFSPMTRHTAARRVVEAVQSGEATLGIVPLPKRDEDENWWRHLVSEREGTPKIIARLPFIGPGNARNPGLEALVICPVEHEETGRDRSYLAIEATEDIGYSIIEKALTGAGYTVAFHQHWHDPSRPPGWFYLVEVFGFIKADGRQVKQLLGALGKKVNRIVQLGGYATPLSAQDLKPSKKVSGKPKK
ncbi:MAG: chorismate mutase [Rhodospirillales bacterium]|nr:chorismate mutase [Rhodospirillales bacterium]